MEAIQLDQRICLRFEDYQKATGFQREDICELNIAQPKLMSEDASDSEDLISVVSDQDCLDEIANALEEMRQSYQLVKGGTKAMPIEGDYDEDQIIPAAASSKQKGQDMDCEENFDDMVVDVGVCTNMSVKYH